MGRVADTAITYKGVDYEVALDVEGVVTLYQGDSQVGMARWNSRTKRIEGCAPHLPAEIVPVLSQQLVGDILRRKAAQRAHRRQRKQALAGPITSIAPWPAAPFEFIMRARVQEHHVYSVFVSRHNEVAFFRNEDRIGTGRYDHPQRTVVDYQGKVLAFGMWVQLMRRLTQYQVR